MATQRQHGKPRSRGKVPYSAAQRAAHAARVQRQKDARRIAALTPEERARWRV